MTHGAFAATAMLRDMLRLILFKFLPRRLLPLIALWEVVQLVRRLRAGRPLFGDDQVIEGHATPVQPRPVEPQP